MPRVEFFYDSLPVSREHELGQRRDWEANRTVSSSPAAIGRLVLGAAEVEVFSTLQRVPYQEGGESNFLNSLGDLLHRGVINDEQRGLLESIYDGFRELVETDADNSGAWFPRSGLVAFGKYRSLHSDTKYHGDGFDSSGYPDPVIRYVLSVGPATRLLEGPRRESMLDGSGNMIKPLGKTELTLVDNSATVDENGEMSVYLYRFSGAYDIHSAPEEDNMARIFMSTSVALLEPQAA